MPSSVPDQPPKAPGGLASAVTVENDLRGKAILAPAIHLFKEGFQVFKAGLAVEVLLAFFRGQKAVIRLPYWFVPQGHARQLIPEVRSL